MLSFSSFTLPALPSGQPRWKILTTGCLPRTDPINSGPSMKLENLQVFSQKTSRDSSPWCSNPRLTNVIPSQTLLPTNGWMVSKPAWSPFSWNSETVKIRIKRLQLGRPDSSKLRNRKLNSKDLEGEPSNSTTRSMLMPTRMLILVNSKAWMSLQLSNWGAKSSLRLIKSLKHPSSPITSLTTFSNCSLRSLSKIPRHMKCLTRPGSSPLR